MACKKYTLTNTGTTIVNFNYRRCDDSMWEYQVELTPSQTKNVWLIDGTYSTSFSHNIVLENDGSFPPTTPYPSPTPPTPTPTPTPVPVLSGESMLFYSTIQGSPNWHYGVLDYKNSTASPRYDTGLNAGDWDVQNTNYVTTLKGYMLWFRNGSLNHFLFIDATGTLVEDYYVDSNSLNADSVDGDWITINDYQNKIFKYFNGGTVYSVNYSSYDDYGIYWDWDGTVSNGSLVMYANSGTTTTFEYLNNGNRNIFHTYNNTIYDNSSESYSVGNYTVVIQYTRSLSAITAMFIYDLTGNLIHNIDVQSKGTLNNWDFNYYGNGKFVVIFYNNNNINTPYSIWSYDGVIDDLIYTTHARGTNYRYWNTYYNTYPWISDGNPSETFELMLYDDNGYYDNYFYSVAYCDFLTFYDGMSSPSLYIFQDSGNYDKSITFSIGLSNSFYIYVNNGDSNLSLLTISGDTNTLISLGLSGNTTGLNSNISGNNFYSINSSGGSIYSLYIFNPEGIVDLKQISSPNSGGLSYDTFAIASDTNSYYFNSVSTGITSINAFTNSYISDYYYNPPTYNLNGVILCVSGTNLDIITRTSSVTGVTLSANNSDWNLRVGKDSFMYTYGRPSDNHIVVELIDFSGNTLRSVVFTQTSWDRTSYVSDRAFVRINNGDGSYTNYMFTSSMDDGLIFSNHNYNYAINDYLNSGYID